MWVPKTEAEIRDRATAGDLTETAIFEGKRELPTAGKSIDLAIDVAALASEGGVLLYGLGEDERRRLTILAPFPLAGVAERIDSIVRSSIAEPPTIEIKVISTEADSSIGYVAVVVPASPRAPHMVVKDKDHRYYGRSATGNVRLTEGEVARLYERRRRFEVDREAIITEEIATAPLQPHTDFAYLFIGVRPVVPDDRLLDRATARLDPARNYAPDALFRLLVASCQDDVFPRPGHPLDLYPSGLWQTVANGFQMIKGFDDQRGQWIDPSHVLTFQVDYDGSGHLFCGAVAQSGNSGNSRRLYFSEDLLAALTTRLLHLLGAVYEAASYLSPVNVGLAAVGLEGAVSGHLSRDSWNSLSLPRYNRREYRRTGQFSAVALASEPTTAARELTQPLYRVVGNNRYDPFARKLSPTK